MTGSQVQDAIEGFFGEVSQLFFTPGGPATNYKASIESSDADVGVTNISDQGSEALCTVSVELKDAYFFVIRRVGGGPGALDFEAGEGKINSKIKYKGRFFYNVQPGSKRLILEISSNKSSAEFTTDGPSNAPSSILKNIEVRVAAVFAGEAERASVS